MAADIGRGTTHTVFTVYEAVEMFQRLMLAEINNATEDEQLRKVLARATDKALNAVIFDFEGYKLKG